MCFLVKDYFVSSILVMTLQLNVCVLIIYTILIRLSLRAIAPRPNDRGQNIFFKFPACSVGRALRRCAFVPLRRCAVAPLCRYAFAPLRHCAHVLFSPDRRYPRQFLPFHIFQHGTTTGGDITDLIRQPVFIYCSY
jgi:hypothetical protein